MDCCCGWLWLDLLAISRTLCSATVSGAMLPTVPDFAGKKKTGMERSVHPPLSAGPAGGRPYGSGTGGAPATPLAANALYASRRQLRAWPEVCGGVALSWTWCLHSTLPAADFGSGPEARRWGVQLDTESLYTPLAADFGPGGGCDGGALTGSWTGSLLSTPLAANFGPCPERAAEGRSAGLGVHFLRLLPPTSGLARRRQRRGARLDRESLCTPSGQARRRRRSWTGSLLRRRLRARPGGDVDFGNLNNLDKIAAQKRRFTYFSKLRRGAVVHKRPFDAKAQQNKCS